MKQAIMTAPGKIDYTDLPIPQPGPGQVLMEIKRIGVCGSDLHVYHGKHPYTRYPVVQGHEYSGTIKSIGYGVTGLQPGMKATSLPQISCGVCPPCLRGDYHICDSLKVEGFQSPGCAQEFWLAEASKTVPLPSTFTFEQGALVEPLAVATHAVARAGNLQGCRIAVLGAGPIGNLVAQVAHSISDQVIITDLSEYRLDIARQCGIPYTSNVAHETLAEASQRVFGNDGFNVVFECVGVEATISAAITTIQKGGTLVVVGVFGEKPRVDIGLVQDRELNLHGTLMYKLEDYQSAIRLLDTGDVKSEPLISQHFPFEQYLDAYRFIVKQGDNAMKVFIDIAE